LLVSWTISFNEIKKQFWKTLKDFFSFIYFIMLRRKGKMWKCEAAAFIEPFNIHLSWYDKRRLLSNFLFVSIWMAFHNEAMKHEFFSFFCQRLKMIVFQLPTTEHQMIILCPFGDLSIGIGYPLFLTLNSDPCV